MNDLEDFLMDDGYDQLLHDNSIEAEKTLQISSMVDTEVVDTLAVVMEEESKEGELSNHSFGQVIDGEKTKALVGVKEEGAVEAVEMAVDKMMLEEGEVMAAMVETKEGVDTEVVDVAPVVKEVSVVAPVVKEVSVVAHKADATNDDEVSNELFSPAINSNKSLFIRPDGLPMTFRMSQGGLQCKMVQQIVENGGGVFLQDSSHENQEYTIDLGVWGNIGYVSSQKRNIFDLDYLRDCVKKGEILSNLVDYRIYSHHPIPSPQDPLDVLLGYEKWNEVPEDLIRRPEIYLSEDHLIERRNFEDNDEEEMEELTDGRSTDLGEQDSFITEDEYYERRIFL